MTDSVVGTPKLEPVVDEASSATSKPTSEVTAST